MSESRGVLVVVPTEHHVEWLTRDGRRVETRRALFRRLVHAFLPDVEFASKTESFLAVASAIGAAAPHAKPDAEKSRGAPILAHAIERAKDALLDAHGSDEAAARAFAKSRLRAFRKECDAADATLARAGLVHARRAPAMLAEAISNAEPSNVARVVGADRVTTRFLFEWSQSDGAFFRALDRALSRVGGGAEVVLPEVHAALDATREESPHEIVAQACARAIDGAPRFIASRVPGTFSGEAAREWTQKTSVARASDGAAEAAACAHAIKGALARGVFADAIGLVLPHDNERVARVFARELAAHGIVANHADASLATSPLVVTAFEEAQSLAPATASRAEYVQFAFNLFRKSELFTHGNVGAFGVLSTDSRESALGRAELDAIARVASAKEALTLFDYVSACKRLSILDGTISIDAFLEEARRTMPPARDPAARRAGAVRVGQLFDFVGLPLELLVVANAHENSMRENPFLTDDAVTRATFEHRAAERVALASSLEASNALVFSYASRDHDGGELAPAQIVSWLLENGASRIDVGASPFDRGRTSPRDARLAQIAASDAASARLAPDAHARAEVERVRERFFLDASRARSPLTGALRDDLTIYRILSGETGGGDRALSVTALEKIASCAFVGFAECACNAKEKMTVERVPDAREEGTLVHAALAAAFNACADLLKRDERNVDAIVARGIAAARAHMDSLDSNVPAVIAARVDTSVAVLLARAANDREYAFFAAEKAFGGGQRASQSAAEDDWPAHVVTRGDEHLMLRGTIDRVDLARSGDRVRVIDYKRRKTTIKKAARTLGESSLQVPLYATVASRALSASIGECGYLPTDARDLSDLEPPKSLAEAMRTWVTEKDGISAIETRALDLVTEVRRGDIAPIPFEPAVCTNCPHDGACRKPRFTIEPEEGA